MEERFDLNRTQVSGIVQRIWDYGEDIFVRLEFVPGEDRPPRYITLKIPGGMVDGQFVSIQPGERIQVEGYLTDVPYTESIQEYFRDAKTKPFYEDTDQAEAWEQIEIERVGTQIVVTSLASITSDPRLNSVMIQGVVARSWKGGADAFARLAIYDTHTEIIGHDKQKDLPRRKPHYITLRIPGGEIDGKKVVIRKRDRLRASGQLHIHFYRQTLPQILKRADKQELVETIPPQAEGIYAVRDSLYVIGDSVVVFAKRKTVSSLVK